jgi:GT2 family glycosyltransferase
MNGKKFMTFSWVILTMNRKDVVNHSCRWNWEHSGRYIDEIIWVDNGSIDDLSLDLPKIDVSILYNKNTGVARGYNSGIVMTTGDWVIITGCDRIMPQDWLKTFQEYIEKFPDGECFSMYSQPIEVVKERVRGILDFKDGLKYVKGLPFGARVIKKSVYDKIGYLREDFGLYGWEDVEWAERCEKNGIVSYVILDQIPRHVGDSDSREYQDWKNEQVKSEKTAKKLEEVRNNNYPYYNPFYGR